MAQECLQLSWRFKAPGNDVDGHFFVSEQLFSKAHPQLRGIPQGRHPDGGLKALSEDLAGDIRLPITG